MITKQVKDIAEYVEVIEIVPLLNGFSIFRGQALKGNLLPGIARKNPLTDTTAIERRMLDKLTLMGASLIADQATCLDRLVQAQHFGLRTRLLDWTSNPLAALWFGCSSPRSGNAYVYALSTDGMLLDNAYSSDPLELSATKVVQPRLNNPRVLAQHSWFTLHCFSRDSARWVRLETHSIAKESILEIVVLEERRSEMLKSLDRLGVSARTLFPDLGGLCRYLNWEQDI